MNYNEFEEAMYIKAALLADGLKLDTSLKELNYNYKKYHLYDHSTESPTFNVPEDIILHEDNYTDKPIIARNRFNSKSPWTIKTDMDTIFLEGPDGYQIDVTFPKSTSFGEMKVNNQPLDRVVTKLGSDLCGVILSNNCFYFGSKQECKFCEILPTYLEKRSFPQATKRTEHVIEAYRKAIVSEPSFEHIVLTTGNVGTYNHTCELFEEIGKGIQDIAQERNITVTGTLMPPTDFHHIDFLKEAGYDNIYFDLEIYDRELFKIIAPGKADYGYDRMLEAMDYAIEVFGRGHVFNNMIYGIQSLSKNLEVKSLNFNIENEKALEATGAMCHRGILPVFTVYHSSGRNKIGPIKLDGDLLFDFFKRYGEIVVKSGIIPKSRKSMVFSLGSTSNTMYNDGYVLADIKQQSENVVKGRS